MCPQKTLAGPLLYTQVMNPATERHHSDLLHPRHFRIAAILAGLVFLFLVLLGLSARPQRGASADDMIAAARLYAARQSDGGEGETNWCDTTSITLAGEGLYRVTGCVVGSWNGWRGPRHFTAIVEDRRVAYVDHLPIREFRFLD